MYYNIIPLNRSQFCTGNWNWNWNSPYFIEKGKEKCVI